MSNTNVQEVLNWINLWLRVARSEINNKNPLEQSPELSRFREYTPLIISWIVQHHPKIDTTPILRVDAAINNWANNPPVNIEKRMEIDTEFAIANAALWEATNAIMANRESAGSKIKWPLILTLVILTLVASLILGYIDAWNDSIDRVIQSQTANGHDPYSPEALRQRDSARTPIFKAIVFSAKYFFLFVFLFAPGFLFWRFTRGVLDEKTRITRKCPRCTTPVSFPLDATGKQARCNRCGGIFAVPAKPRTCSELAYRSAAIGAWCGPLTLLLMLCCMPFIGILSNIVEGVIFYLPSITAIVLALISIVQMVKSRGKLGGINFAIMGLFAPLFWIGIFILYRLVFSS